MGTFDRELHISIGANRKAVRWQQCTMRWLDLLERLKTPQRGSETMNAYLALPKSRQDELKDVGGFVAGVLRDGRRKAANVISRDIVALDLDDIPVGKTNDALCKIDSLNCVYAVYSTRKHSAAHPRLRVLLPLDRSVTADEYEPIARAAAAFIGIEMCDPTTFEAVRLMYWPSCCLDGEYVFQAASNRDPISADGLLGSYSDWKDYRQWPQVPGHTSDDIQRTLGTRQQDPTAKDGIIGAWCREYTIETVIAKYLSDKYLPVDGDSNRYTFAGGSTTGGAVLYDGGKYLYSHHATDPCSGKLVNSFDLVRLHLFGHLDDNALQGTPVHRLPSYIEATKFAIADENVSLRLSRERIEKAEEAFGKIGAELSNENWIKELEKSPTSGKPTKTTTNVSILLRGDKRLAGRIRFNEFSQGITGVAPLPWAGREEEEGEFPWTDSDDAGLRTYVERILGFSSPSKVSDAMLLAAKQHSFNPVLDYIIAQQYDGKERLDTLFIDYLGADDSEYTRTVARKTLVGAVARAITPGVKFDMVSVIQGPQGIGKTTLVQKLGREWFTNSIKTFEGKEAAELLQGRWLVEIGELEAFRRSDFPTIKSFLSRTEDHFRAAYARYAASLPRRCIFIGTTNSDAYLTDPTGNRRFYPITAAKTQPKLSVITNLDDYTVGQIWAEAYMRYQFGESLVMPAHLEREAEVRRGERMERDEWQGLIEMFLDQPIPEDWYTSSYWTEDMRLSFWQSADKDAIAGNTPLVPRQECCILEIWKYGMKEPGKTPKRAESFRISRILKTIGWQPIGNKHMGMEFGTQKVFRREAETETSNDRS